MAADSTHDERRNVFINVDEKSNRSRIDDHIERPDYRVHRRPRHGHRHRILVEILAQFDVHKRRVLRERCTSAVVGAHDAHELFASARLLADAVKKNVVYTKDEILRPHADPLESSPLRLV